MTNLLNTKAGNVLVKSSKNGSSQCKINGRSSIYIDRQTFIKKIEKCRGN
jgi:hypothetical protein